MSSPDVASSDLMPARQTLTILGSTGSIGCSTLDVVARHRGQFDVYALTGYSRIEALAQQCREHHPKVVVVPTNEAATRLRHALSDRAPDALPEILIGEKALEKVSAAAEVTTVMASIVGAAGLAPTLAAARSGKRVLLANKEALVMAGGLFMQACREGGGMILPIDSEHNAVFQCLPATQAERVARAQRRAAPADERSVLRIILTASGGPFRDWSEQQMSAVTPEQACAHPNWSMGRKISVDSATMMNKGLELIEAHYLFDMPVNGLDVVVHPQSIVHSMVEYSDGSTLAQMGNPDMRTPIAHALAFPRRMGSGVAPLSLAEVKRLDFESPDPVRFPCLALAAEALQSAVGPCVINAANEIAVQAFLDREIGFNQIAQVNRTVLGALAGCSAPDSIEAIMGLDREARTLARQALTS
ncbi:MAG: 1-deoxy-D-xylulose-5-phosphate reductoisomerase [Burkholderiaceae bacterium]